jgi:nicotinamidase-related amidase
VDHASSAPHGGDLIARFAPAVDLEAEASCLVLVDLQYGLASRTEGLGRLLAAEGRLEQAAYRFDRVEQTVVPNARRLLAGFRERRLPRAFMVVGASVSDYSDVPPHLRALCRATNSRVGEREHEGLDEIAPGRDEPVITKATLSAFASTPLEGLLRSWRVTTLVFAGVTTNMCVEHNVRDAADRGFACAVVDDACATDSQAMHDASLAVIRRLYGTVMSTDEVLERIGASSLTGAPAGG